MTSLRTAGRFPDGGPDCRPSCQQQQVNRRTSDLGGTVRMLCVWVHQTDFEIGIVRTPTSDRRLAVSPTYPRVPFVCPSVAGALFPP